MEEDKLHIRSEEVQEILTRPPSWLVRWGITLICAMLILILGMSFLIKYPDYLSATVLVTTKQPTEKVISRYTGQINKLFVTNGEKVKVDQVLGVLKNTANYKDVQLLKTIMDTLHFKNENFYFPIEKTGHLILGDIEADYIAFEKSYIDYDLLRRLNHYKNDIEENKKSIDENKTRLKNQLSQQSFLEEELALKRKDLNRYKTLYNKGVISQQEYEAKKMEVIQYDKNMNAMAISISQLRENGATLNNTLKNNYLSESEDRTKILKNLAQSLNTLKMAIRDWEYNYVLKSSTNGRVSFQNYWGENQHVNTGDLIFTILPQNNEQLIGKLVLPSLNSGKLRKNQKVLIKLDNYPYQQFGMLMGKVDNISIATDNDGNYAVYIDIPNGTKTSYNRNINYNQELTGSAEIITQDVCVAERILFKFNKLMQ
ncbi:HlyD family secretion protein [Zhouia sp. PK063]|uniref:HlyD family secretion protein n=1 Tax=Zhouia sp. PK063 TaxID=3373602 RepID=UPI00379C70A5